MTNPWDIEVVPEADLLALFARRRPDAASFRAAVEARIRAREGGGDGWTPSALEGQPRAARRDGPDAGPSAEARTESRSVDPQHEAVPAFWRRVAAILPFDPVTGGAATGGTATGLALAKAFGGKVGPLALALPGLVLLGLVGSVMAALRAVRRTVVGGGPEEALAHVSDPDRGRGGWGRARASVVTLGIVVGSTVMLAPPTRHAMDGVILVLAASVLWFQGWVRDLTWSNHFTRVEVAKRICTLLLLPWIPGGLLRERLGHVPDISYLGGVAFALALLVVAYRVLRGVVAGYALALPLVVLLVNHPVTPTLGSAWGARWTLAGLELDPARDIGWEGAGALVRALRDTQHAASDTTNIRRDLQRAVVSERKLSDSACAVAYDLGVLDDAEAWRTLVRKQRIRVRATFETGPVVPWSLSLEERHVTARMRAVADQPPEFLDWVASCTLASWPDPQDFGALERALAVTMKLEALGRTDALAALKPRAHALLRALWVAPGWGFLADAGHFSQDLPASTYKAVEATSHGVELMSRFGVPDGVDPREVEAFVRAEVRVPAVGAALRACFGSAHEREELCFARAALLRLRHDPGLAPGGVLRALLEHRLLFAALLLGSLAFVALRLARPGSTGALP